jgi:MoaA/NifB/PqqE/SkfB family radical SAM enzyme
MSKLPENFCVAPFIQCTTHPSTSFSPCPYLGGTVWNSAKRNILSQWTSDDLESLRQDFLNNKRSPICSRCWHEEDHQKQSLRLRLFDPVNETTDFSFIDSKNFSQHILNKISTKDYLKGPEVLTIKNGNVCNAKCRVCHPGDSSRWVEDAHKLFVATEKKHYDISQQEKNWSDQQIEEILSLAKNLKRLELFGGEPMYNKKVHHMLERMVNLGYSKNIILYINTNGSVNIVEKLPFLKEFKQVEIGVSIDGVADQFEYIRHGILWQDVKNNIAECRRYLEHHRVQYSIDAICTVEILNVFYLPEIKQAVKEILPLAPFWNLLVYPNYLFIKNMPNTVKQAVIDKLNQDPEEFKDIIQILQQPADISQWDTFIELTTVLDQIRNESFQLTFPEFYSIINK